MAHPPEQWNTGPTQRLPRRSVHPVKGRLSQGPRSRRATCGMTFLVTLLLGLLVLGAGSLYAWNRYQNVAQGMIFEPSSPVVQGQSNPGPQPTPDIVKEPFNLLLIGVDTRTATIDEGARSDTLIVVHVDPQNRWASMLSIPRDSCVFIQGVTVPGTCGKVNLAYSHGYANPAPGIEPDASGAALARDTVNQYLDLPARGQRIDYVMQVDFNGFKDIIDAIGGINIDVPTPLFDPKYPSDDDDYGLIRLYIPAGYQHMDGTTALRYARSRHTTTDYGRSARQQEVIKAILQGLREKNLLDQIDTLNDMADTLKHAFRTDLPINEVGTVRVLANLAEDLAQGGRISTFTLGPFDTVIGGPDINTPLWDPADVEARVDEWLMGPASVQPANNPTAATTNSAQLQVEVMNGAQIGGLAGEISTYLDQQGFRTTTPSTAADVYDETLLIDYGDHRTERLKLAQLLGIKPANIISATEIDETPTDPTTDLVLLVGRDYKEQWRGGQ